MPSPHRRGQRRLSSSGGAAIVCQVQIQIAGSSTHILRRVTRMPSPHRRLHRTFLPRRFSGSGGFRAAPTRLLVIFWHRAAACGPRSAACGPRSVCVLCKKSKSKLFACPPDSIIWRIGRRAGQGSDESEQRCTWCFDAVRQPRGNHKHNGCRRQGHAKTVVSLFLIAPKPILFSFW